jgi:hypothetical protein
MKNFKFEDLKPGMLLVSIAEWNFIIVREKHEDYVIADEIETINYLDKDKNTLRVFQNNKIERSR